MRVSLAVVRSIGSPRQFVTAQDAEDFEQELLGQYALAVGGGRNVTDHYVAAERGVLVEFIRPLGQPLWTASHGGTVKTAARYTQTVDHPDMRY